jgi:hypothetical protein
MGIAMTDEIENWRRRRSLSETAPTLRSVPEARRITVKDREILIVRRGRGEPARVKLARS